MAFNADFRSSFPFDFVAWMINTITTKLIINGRTTHAHNRRMCPLLYDCLWTDQMEDHKVSFLFVVTVGLRRRFMLERQKGRCHQTRLCWCALALQDSMARGEGLGHKGMCSKAFSVWPLQALFAQTHPILISCPARFRFIWQAASVVTVLYSVCVCLFSRRMSAEKWSVNTEQSYDYSPLGSFFIDSPLGFIVIIYQVLYHEGGLEGAVCIWTEQSLTQTTAFGLRLSQTCSVSMGDLWIETTRPSPHFKFFRKATDAEARLRGKSAIPLTSP